MTILDAGRVVESAAMDDLKAGHRLVRGGGLAPAGLLGTRQTSSGWDALVPTSQLGTLGEVVAEVPSLEEIAIRLAKSGRDARKEHGHA